MTIQKKGMILALCSSLMLGALPIYTVQAANEISRLVPFQGRLHGSDNKVVTDGVYDLTFNIYDTPTGGTPVWTESHSKVSVIHGYVNVLLGAITPMHDNDYPNVTNTPAYDPSKNNVNFTEKKYLGISIDGGVEMFPRSQLVPSFHAYTANHADHAASSDHALLADDSDRLGGVQADAFAQKSYVTSITNGLVNRTTSLESRSNTLEGKFTQEKANNADKLDGKDYSEFANSYRNVNFGGNDSNINTSQFIDLLNSLGAFSVPHWVAKGSWSYASNQNITATRIVGSLELAGAVIEVFSNASSNYTVRITGAPAGGASHRVFEYINHGSGYTPGWKELVSNRRGKAFDSDKLDGFNSTDFLSSTFENDVVPIGSILIWPTNVVPPADYVECDGRSLSRAAHAPLFSLISTKYGSKNSAEFNIPDYRGLFLRGWAHGSGTYDPDSSRAIGSVQGESFKSHTHSYNWVQGENYNPQQNIEMRPSDNYMNGLKVAQTTGASGGTGKNDETRPDNIAVMFIIKVK